MPDSLVIPQVIGHRGAAASAPENTLAGFRKAKALGCRWVEFDVRLAANGGLAVIHDATLLRTTSVAGRVSDFTLQRSLPLLRTTTNASRGCSASCCGGSRAMCLRCRWRTPSTT